MGQHWGHDHCPTWVRPTPDEPLVLIASSGPVSLLHAVKPSVESGIVPFPVASRLPAEPELACGQPSETSCVCQCHQFTPDN